MDKRFFNTAGPCLPGEHYMLPARERCRDLLDLIDQKHFFVIHAARQSGKTTLLNDLEQTLNAGSDYHALYCSLETAQQMTDPEKGVPAIMASIRRSVKWTPWGRCVGFGEGIPETNVSGAIGEAFADLCAKLDRPLVVLFDEADCLANGTLISFLRQLRDGYVNRSRTPFIHSLALVGMRNIRDYKGRLREDRQTVGSASPFNIVKEALTLRNFTRDEIASLYAQHTEDTGQVFSEDAVDRSWHWTRGQPWLVNAVACQIVEKLLKGDRTTTVTPTHVDEAAEALILRRDTHLDSLLERLKEDRVKRIIQPLILGDETTFERLDDDFCFVRDLGLVRVERGKVLPANPLYAEVIGRVLSYDVQQSVLAREIADDAPAYLGPDGHFDMRRLLGEFQQFWRENSEIWLPRLRYAEAAPHLVLMGFLQRVINGGGRIVREMAAGTGRLDLCVEYREGRYAIEIKIRRGDKTRGEGLTQLARYLDTLGQSEGWLVIFDQRPDRSWDDKLTWETETVDGKTIQVVGC